MDFSQLSINPIYNLLKFRPHKLAIFKGLWKILRKSDARSVIV